MAQDLFMNLIYIHEVSMHQSVYNHDGWKLIRVSDLAIEIFTPNGISGTISRLEGMIHYNLAIDLPELISTLVATMFSQKFTTPKPSKFYDACFDWDVIAYFEEKR